MKAGVYVYYNNIQAENIHPVCVDLEDWDATRKAVEDLGPVHLLVNNASIASMQTILEIDKASLDRYGCIKLR